MSLIEFINQNADQILINTAYLIFLFALVVRDVLWLRIIMTIASFCWIAYAFKVDSLSMQIWNIVFTVINIYQVMVIIKERRPISLSAQQEEIYQDCFSVMSKRDFLRFWSLGEIKPFENDCAAGSIELFLSCRAESSCAPLAKHHGSSFVNVSRSIRKFKNGRHIYGFRCRLFFWNEPSIYPVSASSGTLGSS